jgi:hypothetical protein
MFPLGRIQSPLDANDYKLKAYIPPKYDVTGEMGWVYPGPTLNQRQTNRCVGYTGAGWGICLPVQDNFTDADGDRLYKLCKIKDNNPDGEEGTNLRSLAKVLKDEGMITEYRFAYTVEEVAWWILNRGPIIVGTDWTLGMFSPDKNNVIHPTGSVAGGHGYFLRKKTRDDYFVARSSWGNEFGIGGEVLISMEDFEILLHHGGEAIATIEVAGQATPVKSDGCLMAMLKLLNMK